MESGLPSLKKYEFPQSVSEALKIIHIECERMSKNSDSLSQDLDQLTEFIDDYVFGNPRAVKQKKLGSIQQLQIIQVLTDYFSADTDFSLLCSVFMIVFLDKGRQVEFKISTLSKLLSLNLGEGNKTFLNCAALWWTQQPPSSSQCRSVARSLVHEYIILLPEPHTTLAFIPEKSPLLAGILLTYFSDLYPAPQSNSTFSPPPIQLVKIGFSWLQDHLDLCGAEGDNQGVVTMLKRSPVSGMLVWTIFSPLSGDGDERISYSKLHYTLLQHITEDNCKFSLPPGFLSALTESLLSTFNSGTFSDSQINETLDRFGQMLQAGRGANTRIEEDLVLLLNQLPYNRLINIILSNLS
jgi:hypothetical protein